MHLICNYTPVLTITGRRQLGAIVVVRRSRSVTRKGGCGLKMTPDLSRMSILCLQYWVANLKQKNCYPMSISMSRAKVMPPFWAGNRISHTSTPRLISGARCSPSSTSPLHWFQRISYICRHHIITEIIVIYTDIANRYLYCNQMSYWTSTRRISCLDVKLSPARRLYATLSISVFLFCVNITRYV